MVSLLHFSLLHYIQKLHISDPKLIFTDWILDSYGSYIPQTLLRLAIRQLLKTRQAADLKNNSLATVTSDKQAFVQKLRTQPIAINTKDANEQQYEVKTGVFESFLGPRMKYSCCLFPTGKETLEEAEENMLKEYMVKAELVDGMRILDLGCGWGSATLHFAEHLPNSKITAFSNSKTQREYIEAQLKQRNLKNVEVITGDVATYDFESESEKFDRVVSIEMFEHCKNYDLLMAKVARTLKPGGKLLVQILCHCTTPYDFNEGWMARYFFAGGTMPSADLLLYFQKDLQIQKQWWVNGSHYSKTLQVRLETISSR